MKKGELRPGVVADFLFYSDYLKDNFHFMHSLIFEISQDELILSQSSPPLPVSSLNQKILLTYLTKQDGRTVRLGFPARIVELIRGYKLASQNRVPAIAVQPTGDTVPFEVRLYYRLKVPSRSDLKVAFQGHRLNLYDISIGGAHLGYEKPILWKANMQTTLTIEMGNRMYPIEAVVLRVWKPPSVKMLLDVTFAAVRFIHVGSSSTERFLEEAILQLQRELMMKKGFA